MGFMTDKAHIWEYFDNNNFDKTEEKTTSINEYNPHNQSKRVKNSEKPHISQDVAWIKSLLHPSMEKSFIKFEVSKVILATKSKLILHLKPPSGIYPEIGCLTGFFDAWWWKNSLTKVEFNSIQKLSDSFPFLKRLINNENILTSGDNFALFLNNPKMIRDVTDDQKALITCKRFLIIEQ
jgi:hypothetical protein